MEMPRLIDKVKKYVHTKMKNTLDYDRKEGDFYSFLDGGIINSEEYILSNYATIYVNDVYRAKDKWNRPQKEIFPLFSTFLGDESKLSDDALFWGLDADQQKVLRKFYKPYLVALKKVAGAIIISGHDTTEIQVQNKICK